MSVQQQLNQPATEPVLRKPAIHPGAASARPTRPLAPMLPATLTTLLVAIVALRVGNALAANTAATITPVTKTLPTSHAKLVQQSPTGKGKTERPAVTKLRAQTIKPPVPKPGKTVMGNRTLPARTIVTKRILPP
jgi:hypothetical protein